MIWREFWTVLVICLYFAESFPTGTPPSFNTPLADQVVAMTDAGGTNVGFSLTCDVSGDPVPTIGWYRGGVVLSEQTSKTLTISAPIRDDVDATLSGVEYFCVATSSTFGAIRSRTATVRLSTFPTTTWQAARSAISINARQGSSVFIPCNPPSSAVPTPTVLWQSKTTGTADNTYETITTAPLTNRNVNMRFQIAPNSGLIIHSLVAADFGRTYRCSVTNAHTHTTVPGGQVYQLMQENDLPGSPDDDPARNDGIHIYYHNTSLMAERGTDFVVVNVVAPAGSNMIDTTIYREMDQSTAGSAFQGLYTISNIQTEENVTAIYQQTDGFDSITIGVLETTITLFDPAKVTNTSSPHRMLTGESVTLTCVIDATPAATVSWYKDSVMLSSGTSNTYTINNAQTSNNGMYQCFASNEHGDSVGSISLQVRDPELSFSRPLARETSFVQGDNVSLTVAVKSDLAPTLKWFVRGEEVTGSNGTYLVGERMQGGTDERRLTEYNITLTVYSINTTYEGEYRVEARTSADNLMAVSKGNVLQERLTTQVSVEFVNSPCLLLGGNVTMRCVQNGVPRPTVKWTTGNLPVTNGSRFLIQEGDELTLTVFQVQADDDGEYECTAQNQLKNGTMSEEVVGELIAAVTCVPPTIIPPGGDARPSATFGESVTLICAASGTPLPTITWMRGGAAVVPSDRIVIETTFTNTTYITSELRVSSVMESDGGSYTCVAVNDASTVTQMFTIEYRGLPFWVWIVIAVGCLLIILSALIICIAICCACRRSGTYDLGGKEQTDNAEEEFDPLYSSLPATRPTQPPEYKQAPAYPSNTSVVHALPMEMESRFTTPGNDSGPFMKSSYSKESFPRVSDTPMWGCRES
jgi:hypothetical protein